MITIYSWVIPLVITLPILVYMLKPEENDHFGIGAILKLFLSIPILIVWLVYFIVLYWTK